MLARGGRGMPVDLSECAIEPKWDGWRCLARIDHGALRLTSRWRNDLTETLPELGGAPRRTRNLKAIGPHVGLDHATTVSSLSARAT
jgi:ATP-dependent DNA ligase